MKFKMRRKKSVIILLISIMVLFTFFHYQNNSIVVNKISFQNVSIPDSFEQFKILQISDFHNKEFGDGQKDILEKIKKIKPDVIFITGDLIDSYNTKVDISMELINGIKDIAQVYYVSGNHEARIGIYDEFKCKLEDCGVIVLENQKVDIVKDDDFIELIGLSDKSFNDINGKKTENILSELAQDNDNFKILLSHRPDLFHTYTNSDVDLVFSGHAHGGQFRLPFISGGLVAPNQGFFPKYTEGIHSENNTSMIVSRGLGNSIIPVRIFNRPELIVVTLTK